MLFIISIGTSFFISHSKCLSKTFHKSYLHSSISHAQTSSWPVYVVAGLFKPSLQNSYGKQSFYPKLLVKGAIPAI